MNPIGANVRELRSQHSLTQEQLARICGVNRATVNKWESGMIRNLRISSIERLCDFFGLSWDDLLSERAGLAAQVGRRMPRRRA